MQNPRINLPNPCPMLSSRMKDVGGALHCSSCKTKVFDFTNSTNEEIKAAFNNGTKCGIFSEKQIENPFEKKIWSYRVLFKFLVLLSFLGFNVNPLNAQSTKKNKLKVQTLKEKQTNYVSGDRLYLQERKVRQRRLKKSKRKKKKQKFRVTGCPAF